LFISNSLSIVPLEIATLVVSDLSIDTTVESIVLLSFFPSILSAF